MLIFRLFFWLLLLSNLVLLALMTGPLPGLSSLEPERLGQQVRTDQIKILSNPLTLNNGRAVSEPAPGPCTEVGNFTTATAAKFEGKLARIKLPSLPVKQLIQPPPSSLVFIPSQADEATANRRLALLRSQGFNDVSVVKEPLPRRWGISVGLFNSPELALARLDSLRKAGITDARIEEFPINSAKFAYQLQGVAADEKPELKAVLSDFPGTEIRSCKR